ncbi:class I adenylate-forming enzyme family protein [Sandarakinorhabdus sp. DWP1-3-1]|uniref:class I adenylate-forming enzyme family protein n=1 Tax=Sandarakinorhabdus sp. DWP1-3-1 TaxID=2804627 RepID=UPI003CF61681
MLPDDFTTLPDLVRGHAQVRGAAVAIIDGPLRMDWATFDRRCDRVAAALQRDGLGKGDVIAIAATMQADYLVVWLGALRAGLAVAPLPQSVTAEALAGMVADAGAAMLFDDAALAGIEAWLAPDGSAVAPVAIGPDDPFNLIYSSGTTGRPKGIVQPHSQRWAHVQRGLAQGYGPDAVTLVATPLYSNTTLVSVIPTLGLGGTLVLLPKFDTAAFLALSVAHGVSHVMLVPVQYRRLLEMPDFDRFDLSAYRAKFCTSAPFPAALKAEVLRRWPGGLTEYYGMTEGGGTCILRCHERPDKLATVGQPAAGSDIRLIDAEGRELPAGATGEVVGRSPAMMQGYHGLPEATRAAEWFSPDGARFIRTGDIGRFDDEGFLTLVDRAKDLVISGGFNIYPSDLEGVLAAHPDVVEAAVVAVPSARWGETPVAFVVARAGADAAAIRGWANDRLGRTQRIADVALVDSLPRSEIGKVLKRELRDAYRGDVA